MNIAKRQRVENLRTIWPKETEFSDWLVSESGLELIAEDVGIEIEEPQRECRPGDYPCDVVARKVGDENHIVVIENQFGKTNHDHLGKLLTYTAMNSAMTCIWLSEIVSDDHRKVIDWLNDNTPPQVSFYLAEIKAYRIGESLPAPQLDVVCRPNLEAKVQRESNAGELKERHIWRRDFWVEISDYIKSKNPPFRPQSPTTDHWLTIALGRGGFHMNLLLVPKHQKIGCEVIIAPLHKERAFEQLQNQKSAIEHEIGQELQWQSSPNVKRARIALETEIDPGEMQNKQAVKEWMHHFSLAFYKAFAPRVKTLDL